MTEGVRATPGRLIRCRSAAGGRRPCAALHGCEQTLAGSGRVARGSPRASGVQRGWGSVAEVFRRVSQGFWLACRACGARSVVDVAGLRPGKRWRRGWLQDPARHEVQGEIKARLASSETKGRAGRTAESMATSTLAVGDLPDALELSNGSFSSVERR
jgi:hypothetical protein